MHRLILSAMGVALLAGCASNRVSRYDEFEQAKVDRTVGNSVSGRVFQRTVVCLNVMRELRHGLLRTNQTVHYFTNSTVVSVTNLTVTTSASRQVATTTNAFPALTMPVAAAPETGAETNTASPPMTPPGPSTSGSLTLSTSSSESLAAGTNQTVTSGVLQAVTTLTAQTTITTNNLSITSGTNSMVTVETNYVITTFTNLTLIPVTNSVVQGSEDPASDYYLVLELTPPLDFTLHPGESLILLVDGVRQGFVPATPQTAWANRRGFVTSFYEVAPDLLVDIANAEEVKLRIKGTAGTIERRMNRRSREHIREFLLQYCTAGSCAPAGGAGKAGRGRS